LHKIGIRVDGNGQIGMGHIFQQIQLAMYLEERLKSEIFFMTNREKIIELLAKKFSSFHWNFLPQNIRPAESLKLFESWADNQSFNAALYDITDPYPELKQNPALFTSIERMRKEGIATLAIELMNTKKLNTDVVINGSLVEDWHTYHKSKNTEYYLGPEYVILNPIYENLHSKKRKIRNDLSEIFVCMGGSDPSNITKEVLKTLSELKLNFKITVVLGPAYNEQAATELTKLPFTENVSFQNVSWRIWEHMLECDIAIASAGRMPYELCATGTPSLLIPIVKHQEHTAEAFQSQGAAINLTSSFKTALGDSLQKLIKNKWLQIEMSIKGKQLVDGRGLKRIARIISSLLRR
jgi:UDP-2,4-diacetamido-2,4,6-trideoxy-beta-L-altropyranose hydrolase